MSIIKRLSMTGFAFIALTAVSGCKLAIPIDFHNNTHDEVTFQLEDTGTTDHKVPPGGVVCDELVIRSIFGEEDLPLAVRILDDDGGVVESTGIPVLVEDVEEGFTRKMFVKWDGNDLKAAKGASIDLKNNRDVPVKFELDTPFGVTEIELEPGKCWHGAVCPQPETTVKAFIEGHIVGSCFFFSQPGTIHNAVLGDDLVCEEGALASGDCPNEPASLVDQFFTKWRLVRRLMLSN